MQYNMSSPTDGRDVLQPGQHIRPTLSDAAARRLVETRYGFHVTDLVKLPSYDDVNYLVGVDTGSWTNRHVQSVWPHGYVLKVLNSLDSRKQHVGAEHEMMKILRQNAIMCPQPILNIHGKDNSLESLTRTDGSDGESSEHIVRLLAYVPGERLVTAPYTAQLLNQAGQFCALIDNTLSGFEHLERALKGYTSIWCLGSVPKLRQFTYSIADDNDRTLILDVIAEFERTVVPNIPQFTHGVIHGDYNDQNVLVRRSGLEPDEFKITAIIDFSHANVSPYVFEVSLAIMYLMLNCKDIVDVFDVGGHVLAGYLSHRQLSTVELSCVRACVAARYAQSMTMAMYSYSQDPSNEYLLLTTRCGWARLRQLWSLPERELYARWNAVLSKYGLGGSLLVPASV